MATLLFIHGAGGNRKIWKNQVTFFNNVKAIDLTGHPVGEGKDTIPEYVEEVRRLCYEKELKEIVMVGVSMGGAIVQKFALDYPEYLKAIVLVSTGAKLKVLPTIFEAIKQNYSQAIELIAELLVSKKTAHGIKEKLKAEMRSISPEVMYGDFKACNEFNVLNEVKRIRMPTLVICGLEDQLTPVKYSEYLKNNIPNSKLEIIADAGHMVMLEKPEEFNRKLEKFIKEIGF